jgi:hypothetical protein
MSRGRKEILCLFDVDGTVTRPRQVSFAFYHDKKRVLSCLLEKFDV